MAIQIETLIHEVREVLTDRLDAISTRLDASLQHQAESREAISAIDATQKLVMEHLKNINGQLLTHAEKIELLQAFRERHPLECTMKDRLEALEDFGKASRIKKSMWKNEFAYVWAVLLVNLHVL